MFRDYSISKKMTWTNMLVSGAALLLACAAFIGYDLVSFRRAAVYNLSIQAQIAGSNAVSAILFDDPSSAEKTLSALQASPNIVSAGILTLDGRPFAAYSRNKDGKIPVLPSLAAGQDETYRFGGGAVLLVRSIVFQGKPTGTIYIQSSMEGLYARLKLYAGISAIVLAVSLLVALLISPIVQREVARPIVQLAEIAQLISRDKNYSVRAEPSNTHDEISVLVDAFNSMLTQIQERDGALRRARDELEQKVHERTSELTRANLLLTQEVAEHKRTEEALETANKELDAFSYSVSHDLRAPLRGIDGFSQALLEDYGDKLDSVGQDHLQRVRLAAQRMSTLIDDLLKLSRVTRSEMHREQLDLSAVVKAIAEELQHGAASRNVTFVITEGLMADGDPRLLRVAIENLLGNSWKYTSAHSCARIEFGIDQSNGRPAYFIRDDGAGFDPRYSERLFGAFQRLHAMNEFPGTGIGLATVQRIIRKHGGEIWAEGEVEKGATFYFTL
jgi:signal transduction histidine kinase